MTLASGKESGGIEFTSDVVLGLQLFGVGFMQDFDSEEAKEKDPRELEIVALKNRTGALGSAYLRYRPKWNVMRDATPALKAKADEERQKAKERKAARREGKKGK